MQLVRVQNVFGQFLMFVVFLTPEVLDVCLWARSLLSKETILPNSQEAAEMETKKPKIANVWLEVSRVVWADLAKNVWKCGKFCFEKLLGNNGREWAFGELGSSSTRVVKNSMGFCSWLEN